MKINESNLDSLEYSIKFDVGNMRLSKKQRKFNNEKHPLNKYGYFINTEASDRLESINLAKLLDYFNVDDL